ncbi:hypothetical protein HDC92_000046 [Pedobacter sp. AK017]|nr:hypothetical protein [Pedobacter sp. AK017]
MPFEIFALPVLICFIIGIISGLNTMKREEDQEEF